MLSMPCVHNGAGPAKEQSRIPGLSQRLGQGQRQGQLRQIGYEWRKSNNNGNNCSNYGMYKGGGKANSPSSYGPIKGYQKGDGKS